MIAQSLIESLERIAVAGVGAAGLVGAAWVGARRGARRGTAEAMRPMSEAIETHNGKDIGHTTRDMAETLELVQAQAHSNARDVLGVHERLGRIDAKLDRHEDKLDRISGRVDQMEQRHREQEGGKG